MSYTAVRPLAVAKGRWSALTMISPGRWAVTTETRQAIKAIACVVHVEMV